MTKINKKGFTLIELMVVMAIIAVLSVLIIGAIQIARKTATETTNRGNAKTIQTGMEAYYAKKKEYPVFAAGTTFNQAIATGALLNGYVTLSSTPCSANGGGVITSTTSTYTITPVDSTCGTSGTALMTDDKLEVK